MNASDCGAREVIQTNILKEFPAKEAKALIGFEVGRLVLQRLPALIPSGFTTPAANAYLAFRAYVALQKATRPKPGLAGAPLWIRDILADRSGFSFKRLHSFSKQISSTKIVMSIRFQI